jgi:hypothetical protein
VEGQKDARSFFQAIEVFYRRVEHRWGRDTTVGIDQLSRAQKP